MHLSVLLTCLERLGFHETLGSGSHTGKDEILLVPGAVRDCPGPSCPQERDWDSPTPAWWLGTAQLSSPSGSARGASASPPPRLPRRRRVLPTGSRAKAGSVNYTSKATHGGFALTLVTFSTFQGKMCPVWGTRGLCVQLKQRSTSLHHGRSQTPSVKDGQGMQILQPCTSPWAQFMTPI